MDKDIEEDQVSMPSRYVRYDGIDNPISSEGPVSVISEYKKISVTTTISKEAKRSDESLERDDVVGGASDIDVNEDPISKDYESLSPAVSRDLLKKDFKESLVLDSDVEADMREDASSLTEDDKDRPI